MYGLELVAMQCNADRWDNAKCLVDNLIISGPWRGRETKKRRESYTGRPHLHARQLYGRRVRPEQGKLKNENKNKKEYIKRKKKGEKRRSLLTTRMTRYTRFSLGSDEMQGKIDASWTVRRLDFRVCSLCLVPCGRSRMAVMVLSWVNQPSEAIRGTWDQSIFLFTMSRYQARSMIDLWLAK